MKKYLEEQLKEYEHYILQRGEEFKGSSLTLEEKQELLNLDCSCDILTNYDYEDFNNHQYDLGSYYFCKDILRKLKENKSITDRKSFDIAISIQNNINWENWKDDNGKYFTVNQVLSNKIEHSKEQLNEDDHVEIIDTLEMLKNVLKLVDIEKFTI